LQWYQFAVCSETSLQFAVNAVCNDTSLQYMQSSLGLLFLKTTTVAWWKELNNKTDQLPTACIAWLPTGLLCCRRRIRTFTGKLAFAQSKWSTLVGPGSVVDVDLSCHSTGSALCDVYPYPYPDSYQNKEYPTPETRGHVCLNFIILQYVGGWK
jgi:hypothetical protein